MAPSPSGSHPQWLPPPVVPSPSGFLPQLLPPPVAPCPSGSLPQWLPAPVAPSPNGSLPQWLPSPVASCPSGSLPQWLPPPVVPSPSGFLPQWLPAPVAPCPSGFLLTSLYGVVCAGLRSGGQTSWGRTTITKAKNLFGKVQRSLSHAPPVKETTYRNLQRHTSDGVCMDPLLTEDPYDTRSRADSSETTRTTPTSRTGSGRSSRMVSFR